MKALIDGDMFPYQMGALKDGDTGDVLPFEMCWKAVQNKIAEIVEAVGAAEYCIFLSSQIAPTWRYGCATILPYKGNREGAEKPAYWGKIRQALIKSYPYHLAEGIEADDAMSIEQYRGIGEYYYLQAKGELWDTPLKEYSHTVICSRDKDLNMVPGWHYGWECGNQKEKPLWFQEEIPGVRCFYKQMLTGDTADNILGLYGVGAKSALVSKIDALDNAQDMYNHVRKCYKDRFGSYCDKFLLENGRLLFMQQTEEQRWEPPITTVKTTQES